MKIPGSPHLGSAHLKKPKMLGLKPKMHLPKLSLFKKFKAIK